MMLATVWGLSGATLLFIAAGLKWSFSRRLALPWRLALALLLLVLAWVPILGLRVAEYVRGAVGDLSVATWVLLVVSVYWMLVGQTPRAEQGRSAMLALIALLGIALYPLALGLSPWDSYSMGFEPLPLIALMAALSLWALAQRFWILWCWLAGAMLAFQLRLLESDNLWDYLIDPLAVIYAWYCFIMLAAKSLMPAKGAAASGTS